MRSGSFYPRPPRLPRLFRYVAAGTSLGALVLAARAARADEPVKASEPTMMAEPGEVVDVIDAFDRKNNDPFDLNLSLGFHQKWERSKIRRESDIGPDGRPSNAGFLHNVENIASYRHTVSLLDIRADVGVWRDIALFLRVPFTLADDRSLGDLDGSTTGVNTSDRAADPATGKPLFTLPFKSPTRSGVDYLAFGARWSVFNQFRDPSKPTWTFELEGRLGVGEPMRPCNDSPQPPPIPEAAFQAIGAAASVASYPQCPTPGAVVGTPSLGTRGGTYYRDPRDGGRKSAGISRGTNAIRFGTMVSNRYRYVEPYGGFWFMAEFQKRNTELGDYSGVDGVLVNHPPLQAGFMGGLMIHPWENREQFQRFTFDLRFNARYVSQGRDYTPLFDALGSSNAPSLIAPNPARYHAALDGQGRPVLDERGVPVSVGDYSSVASFTGVTDVEAHGVFGGTLGFIVQAAKYIRFNGGFGVTYQQAHLLTTADACNPDFSPSMGDSGRCRAKGTGGVTGAPNPNHRPSIDLPGRRFRVSDTFIWDAWLTGTVMF